MKLEDIQKKADEVAKEDEPEGYHELAWKMFNLSNKTLIDDQNVIKMQVLMTFANFLESRAIFLKLKQIEKISPSK